MHAAHVHDALHTALQSCQLGRNVSTQFILTTNEDRDHVDASITRESIETALSELGILLNVAVNRAFPDGS